MASGDAVPLPLMKFHLLIDKNMEKQNRISIGKINGSEIFAVSHESGDLFVPIKPICDAIGIDVDAQRNKLTADEFFNSTTAIITAVAADEKARDMYCIRLRDVYGWLATINPGKVAPEARESVTKYRRQCYDILYNHFFRRSGKLREIDAAERDAVARLELLDKKLSEAEQSVRDAKSQRNEARSILEKIRASRLDDAPSLFD